MRILALCLVMLFPALAFASAPVLKDKYIDCNCHVTPGIPWKYVPAHKAVVHHRHVAKTAQTSSPVKHKRIASTAKPVIASDNSYPGREEIIPSNKLALPAGKSIYADGQIVYISGKVVDKFCVPVSDAIVEIWQADPEGKYVNATLSDRLNPKPVFAGTGRATTNNLGQFNFVTVFPGATQQGRAPFIHVRVLHMNFPTLNTEMFFGDDQRNKADPVFSSLSPEQQSWVTAQVRQVDPKDPKKGLLATWGISLDGKSPWRHF